MSFLTNLDWRYATKKFNQNKKVSRDDLQKILEAIRKTPTSFGIMPFRVIVVSDEKLKQSLQSASGNQPQLGTASDVIIFVAQKNLKKMSDEFFDELSEGNATIRKTLSNYENFVLEHIAYISEENALPYATNQAFIAVGFALAGLAELQIDSCPIGGFEAKKYIEILGLGEGEVPVLALPIGYREEGENPRKKFRLPHEKLFLYR